MSDKPVGPTVYRLDASETITYVNDAWVSFARQNGAATLTAASVTGRPLWDYVVGVATRHIYERLFAEVRKSGRPIVVPFRCDSPTIRRYQEMRIVPLHDGGIECECRVLRHEPQDPSPVPILAADEPRSDASVTMCSWCKRVQDPLGEWMELDKAVYVMQLLSRTPYPMVTHGICPACRASVGMG